MTKSNLLPPLNVVLEHARQAVGELERALNAHCPNDPQVGCLILVEQAGQLAVLDIHVDEERSPQLMDIADTIKSINDEVHGPDEKQFMALVTGKDLN